MEKHETLSPDIDWKSLIHHVSRDHVTVELSEDQVPVARIVPIRKSLTMAELDQALGELPSLGEDAESFEDDLNSAKSQRLPLDDPWDS